ncbi:hypothetical protein [Pseudomonas aeruginosa]|uniref:hypothetical protein n=1 Tax=Pseudomonas aeruginosa TaxID=287 RepID=UPI001E4A193E|nr:hypothetical protein [Pseudomonas aeruginosa]
MTVNEKLFLLTSRKKKTNHILHLILTVLTGGLWLVVWVITLCSNDSQNKKIDREIDQIMHYKSQGLSDAATNQKMKMDKLNTDVLQGRVIFGALVVVFLYFYLR